MYLNKLKKTIALCLIVFLCASCVGKSYTDNKTSLDTQTDIHNSKPDIKLNTWQRALLNRRKAQLTQTALGSKSGLLLKTNKKNHVYRGNVPLAKAATYTDDILVGNVELNYIDVDIKQATRSILNDILKRGFVIDQSITGNVNLKTQGPVSKRKALSLLEDVLGQHDAQIVQEGSLYKVAKKGRYQVSSITTGSVDNESLSGTRVVRLKHITSVEMAEILKPYAGDSILSVDTERNAIVLTGSSTEFRSWMETIRTFDVDWLAGRSVGVFKVDSMTAAKMVESLQNILANENTEVSSARLSVIEANNSVLAIAKTPQILESIKLWVSRLEDANGGSVRLYTYNMKYAQATDVAPVLGDLFSVESSSFGVESASNPVASEADGQDRQQASQDEFGSSGSSGGNVGNSGTRIVANNSSNSLLIYANKEVYERMHSALRTIDVPEKQVLVEAVIVEVTLNENLRHGVQYALSDNLGGLDIQANLTNNTGGLGIAPTVPGFSVSLDSPVQVIIDALDNVTSINVISSPNMMVLNNRTAKLSVGNQVPIATQTQSDPLGNASNVIVNTIEFRDTGVIFDVTPRITSADAVMLDIIQEISSVGPTNETLTPTISQRKFSSSINVNSGQTVVLGGLFSNTKTRARVGIPGLNRLKHVGNLFGRTANENVKTELLVLISPKVIKNASQASKITRELSDRIDQLKQVEDVYKSEQ